MALEVSIRKRLGDFSLRVEFETAGGLLGLLGASGSGKSMTLQCIAGLRKPDAGRIVLNGRTLFDSEKKIDLPPQARRVGYLFQQYALFPNMTVRKNVEAGLHRLPRAARAAEAERRLTALGLGGLGGRRPFELSGGQQQRAALARILAAEPEALLLDEPFSALDSYLRWQVELELSDTLRAFGGDAVLVSHSRDEVCRLCTAAAVLSGGRSQPPVPVRQLFDDPGTVAAALLSGCKNFSAAQALPDGRVFCGGWGVTLRPARPAPEGPFFVGLRAHLIRPAAAGEENAIPCRVRRVVADVFTTILMLETPGGSLLRMELPRGAWEDLGAPERLTAAAPPEAVLLLTGDGETATMDLSDLSTTGGNAP